MKIIGLDLGDSGKLFPYWSSGEKVEFPRALRKNGADHNTARFRWLLSQCDILITECSTIGTYGVCPKEVRDMLAEMPGKQVLICPTRLLKNMRKADQSIEKDDDTEAAIIATLYDTRPASLKPWKYVPEEDRFKRKYSSARKYSKNGYKGPECNRWFSLAAGYVCDAVSVKITRALVIPFAMALEEALSTSRSGFEKVIGLYGHGYPSFYRRKTVELMQAIIKRTTGRKKPSEATPEERKEALRLARRWLRGLYQYMKARQGGEYIAETQGDLFGAAA